jgi:alkylation response protein AidB-like acyl-CoA dehydrogenase
MDLSFTPLQEELRGQARAFLEATPRPAWAQLAELGWTGAGVPEEHGGAGLTFVEEAVLHEEAGRALLHAPLWSTSSLLPFLPGSDQAAVAAGEASWTLALGPLVPDLDTATNVAVVGGDTIWELDGADREVLATSDETRPLGVVSGGEAGRGLCSSDVLPSLRSRSLAILALEAVGVGARAVELTVGYVADREQFGRRIGTYQAVSHPLASSHAEIELARSLAWWAAWCVAHDEEAAPVATAAAKADAADAAVLACERAIQAHGGIGFTWEHVLHRLYKRALWLQSWEASPAQLRAEVAGHLLDRGGT